MRKKWLFALVTSLLPALSPAGELTGLFASGKAPYLWTEGEVVRGAELDIFGAVLRRAGFQLHPRAMPNNRLIATFAEPGVDFAAGVQPADLPGYCHSAVYMSYHNVAITRRKDHIVLARPADLLQHKVAIRQYLYQDLGMDKAGSGMPAAMPGNFAEFASQDQQVKFFFAGRSDAIVIDRSIFQWYATRLGLLADSENSLEIQDIFPARHGVQAVFKDQKMCGLFDAGLAAIVADGTYRAIWQSYGIDDVAGPLL